MMVLTKRVGDSPESQTPSLHVREYQFFIFSACSIFCSYLPKTAVRRIQMAIESGEWTAFCAASAANPQFPPEKATASTRSTAPIMHEASLLQASVHKEFKVSRSLGSGIAETAAFEETRPSAVPSRSSPRPLSSPSRGVQSPQSVGDFSY